MASMNVCFGVSDYKRDSCTFLQASSLPMSIIIVGIGNAEFDGDLVFMMSFMMGFYFIMICDVIDQLYI